MRSEKWWLDRYPGDCIVSLDRRRRFPLFEDSFNEWRRLCEIKGFGPLNAKDLTPVWAEIFYQKVYNKFDPLDERLLVKSDASILAACQRNGNDLPSFQFWEFEGDVVELRLGRKGFKFDGENWMPFNDVHALLENGIPLSYQDMRNRVPADFVVTNESNYLESLKRSSSE
jgi:hypothetical protein